MFTKEKFILCCFLALSLLGCKSQPPEIPVPGKIILQKNTDQFFQIILSKLTLEQIEGNYRDVFDNILKIPIRPFRITEDGGGIWIVRQDGTRSQLVDVETGETLMGESSCKRLSPDGRKSTLLNSKGLYIAGIDGEARLALERRSQMYLGQVGFSSGMAYAGISCPVWLNEDELIVDHVTGAFPATIKGSQSELPGKKNSIGIPTDTTSILQITPDKFNFRSIEHWCIAGISPDNKTAVVSKKMGGGVDPNFESSINHDICDLNSPFYLVDIDYLLSTKGNPPAQITTECSGRDGCLGFTFSPDGQKVAFIENHAGNDEKDPEYFISVWNVVNKTAVGLFQAEGQILIPHGYAGSSPDLFWAPDAMAIAYMEGAPNTSAVQKIFILTLQDGQIHKVPTTIPFPFNLIGWVGE